MTDKIRKKAHTAEFKFKVALEAVKGDRTTAELCQAYGIVSSQLFKWKRALLERGSQVFASEGSGHRDTTQDVDQLHAAIGRLKVENDFLSRVLGRRP